VQVQVQVQTTEKHFLLGGVRLSGVSFWALFLKKDFVRRFSQQLLPLSSVNTQFIPRNSGHRPTGYEFVKTKQFIFFGQTCATC
jgi:hypothetical protein